MGQVTRLDVLAPRIAELQAHGARAVCTNGVFDLLHLGHVRYLQEARALGDLLIVAVNSDDSTRRLKGPQRPLAPEDERVAVLAALSCVDFVLTFAESTAERLVAALRPALYVKGADYASASPTTRDVPAAAPTSYLLDPDRLRAVLAGTDALYPELSGLGARLPEAQTVAAYGGSAALLAYLPGHSTTELIERIVQRYASHNAATGRDR